MADYLKYILSRSARFPTFKVLRSLSVLMPSRALGIMVNTSFLGKNQHINAIPCQNLKLVIINSEGGIISSQINQYINLCASQPRPYNTLLHLIKPYSHTVCLQTPILREKELLTVVSCSLASLWTESQRAGVMKQEVRSALGSARLGPQLAGRAEGNLSGQR